LWYKNEWHLGDCLYHVHFCLKVIEANPDAVINFACNADYHLELWAYMGHWPDEIRKSLRLLNLATTDTGRYDDCWINGNGEFDSWIRLMDKRQRPKYFDHFYVAFFDELCRRDHLISPFIDAESLLFRRKDTIASPLNDPYILFINGKPRSGQYEFRDDEDKMFIEKCKQRGIPVTTTEELREHFWTLSDILWLSAKAHFVVGIHTAPMLVTFNEQNIDTVQNWLILHRQGLTYSFNNRIHNIKSLEEAWEYIK